LLLFIIVPHRLVLYAQRSTRNLLVLGILLLLLLEGAFHYFSPKSQSQFTKKNQ